MASAEKGCKVHLLTISAQLTSGAGTGIDGCAYDKLIECARLDRFGVHTLTPDPEEADLILFAELGFSIAVGHLDAKLRRHPLVHRYRDRCFLYNSADAAIPFLPGLYPSIERRWYDPLRVRSAHYLTTHAVVHPLVTLPFEERDLLYSFLGSAANHPVRGAVVGLTHPRGVARDVSEAARRAWGSKGAALDGFLKEYVNVMSRSRFALCPRGLGTSSIRLFESMRFGVAPVIIADQWVPPTGPDWPSFSLRVAERDVHRIPQLLEEREAESQEMGRRARAAWEEWFADDVTFHRVVNWCREIEVTRGAGGDPLPNRLRVFAQTLRPVHLRNTLAHAYRTVRNRARP